jgi:hypothetical protein
MTDTQTKLMFLSSQKFESGKAIRGAFLLTDSETKPLEFRCTNPIRPTPLQNMLYGDTIEQYIAVELIGKPLFNAASEKPDVILVKEPDFLDLRPKINIPVLQFIKEAEINASETRGNFQKFVSSSGKFEPIVIRTNSQFPEDKEISKDLLANIFNRYDLTEPFARIVTALDQAHAQKIGDV